MNVVQDTCERVVIINEGRIIADELVKNLLDLFRVRVYRIVIQGALTDEQRSALANIPAVIIESESPEQTSLSVRLEDSSVLYEVIGVLGSGNSLIESIDQEQNNFERIFLELVEGGGHSA